VQVLPQAGRLGTLSHIKRIVFHIFCATNVELAVDCFFIRQVVKWRTGFQMKFKLQ